MKNKPQRKPRGLPHFVDLSEDIPIRSSESGDDRQASEKSLIKPESKTAYTANSTTPNDFSTPVSSDKTRESSAIDKKVPSVETEAKLEDLVVIPTLPQESTSPPDSEALSEPLKQEIKRAIEFTSPAPIRAREEKLAISHETEIENQAFERKENTEKTQEKPLATSFEIPEEEVLDKGYHFYCSIRVLDKVRRYARQKNIKISKLITMILDKAIKE